MIINGDSNDISDLLKNIKSDTIWSYKISEFVGENKLPYPLLCDINNILRRKFGVPKKLGFIEGRVTYIIDSNGIIIHIFEDLLNGPAHIKEAVRALKELQESLKL